MTTRQLAKFIEVSDVDRLRIALKSMPDAYVDRWVEYGGQFAQVWCVVVPPENCPKPDK